MQNDLDALLNNVFGSPATRPTSFGKDAALSEDLLGAVERANARINDELRRQTEILNNAAQRSAAPRTTKSPDATAAQARRDVAELQTHLEQDGFAKAEARKSAFEENPRVFAEIEQEAAATVFGQDAFLHRFTLAMKRPFATGRDKGMPDNSILVSGKAHTGRHTAVGCVLALMQQKGLLPAGEAAVLDLSRYPSQNEEKLFLQDLYMALSQKTPILLFDGLDRCHPAFAEVLSDLVKTGTHRLSSRYTMQNGRLIDAGTALVTDAVSSISAEGKFLIFLTTLTRAKSVDRFGAPFCDSFGDICETEKLTEDALRQIAASQAALLTTQAKERLGLNLSCDDTVAEQFFLAAEPDSGAKCVVEARKTMFSALSQWKLESDLGRDVSAALTAAPSWLLTADGQEISLESYLPQTYRGALDEVKAELDTIVGLGTVKDYILSLEDNYKVQARRRAEGMKTASVSMHMIFTGNPGTGKTTIARLVSRYLKAIGVLTGGQLVEVTRADLVGRYVGHTAPLTMSVIRSALGGVLFIDEAYSLYRGEDDSFGLEAIDTLVKGMEDNRENLIVILAGYSREMQEFLTANSGLKSRFPNIIEFPDYTGEELLKIAEINAAQRGYRFADGVTDALLEFFNRAQAENSRENGNGRLARNKLEQAIVNQARRLVAEPESALDELQIGDFDLT